MNVGRVGSAASNIWTGKLLHSPPSVNHTLTNSSRRRSIVHIGIAEISNGKLSDMRVATMTGSCSGIGIRVSGGSCVASRWFSSSPPARSCSTRWSTTRFGKS